MKLSISLFFTVFICSFAFATVKLTHGKLPENKRKEIHKKNSSNLWNIQFAHDVAIGSGTETDGSYYYVSQWNMDSIFVFDMNGNATGSFSISPISGMMDMAYDGSHFYGSDFTERIYEMDFVNHTITDTIVCPSNVIVRHIAYDSVNDAFWVGDWDTDIYLVNRSGQIINTITLNKHQLDAMGGSAFDNITPGGPYLWVSNQSGNYCDIVMLKISTGYPTGIIHDSYADVGADLWNPVIGGLFISQNIIQGTTTLGGILQGQRIFGYNLSTVIAQNDVGVEKIISPYNGGCSLSNTETVTILLRNYGFNSAGFFNINLSLNNTLYPVYFTGIINSFDTLLVTFPGTFDMSAPDVYDMKFFTSFPSDENSSNDTMDYRVITGNGLMTVNLLTDSYPEETYWEITNLFNYEIYGSTPLYVTEPNTLYSTDVCIDTTACYSFDLYDSYGDGILSPGYFEVLFNGSQIVLENSFTTDFFRIPYIGSCDYADVGVVDILTPVSSCFLGNQEPVTVTIKNFGTQTVYSPEISYNVNGTTAIEQISDSLASQEEVEYTFVNLADMSALGNYSLNVYSTYSGDANPFNDTIFYDVENYIPAVTPYNISFDDDTIIEQLIVQDENIDDNTWYLLNNGGVNNSACIYYSYNQNEPANDWLFTKCIDFVQGTNYEIELYYKVEGAEYPENLKVHLSNAPSADAVLGDTILNLYNVTETDYTKATGTFTVSQSGNYFVGFNVYSDANMWNIYLDDISISFPSNIDVTSARDGKCNIFPNPASSTITVTAEKMIDEFYISDIVGRKIKSIINLEPNTTIEISNFPAGVYFASINTNGEVVRKKIVVE